MLLGHGKSKQMSNIPNTRKTDAEYQRTRTKERVCEKNDRKKIYGENSLSEISLVFSEMS